MLGFSHSSRSFQLLIVEAFRESPKINAHCEQFTAVETALTVLLSSIIVFCIRCVNWLPFSKMDENEI